MEMPVAEKHPRERRASLSVSVRFGLAAVLLLSACSPPTNSNPAVRLSCGSVARFDEPDLRRDVAVTGDAPGVALTSFLASSETSRAQLPALGWRRVTATPDVVLFVAQPRIGDDPPFVMVEVVRDDGRWVAATWGECRPRYVGDLMRAASWSLRSTPHPDARSMEVLIADPECAEGPLNASQILPPTVQYQDRVVTVTIWIGRSASLDTARGCPGFPPLPYAIQLSESLGRRKVLDGGVIPARAVHLAAPLLNPGDASPGPDLR